MEVIKFKFDESDLIFMERDGDDAPYWFFAADLRNLMDQDTNYEVDGILRQEGVLLADTDADPETACLWVYFTEFNDGMSFVNRLNEYLWPTSY